MAISSSLAIKKSDDKDQVTLIPRRLKKNPEVDHFNRVWE